MKRILVALAAVMCLGAAAPQEIDPWEVIVGEWKITSSTRGSSLLVDARAGFAKVSTTKTIGSDFTFSGRLSMQKCDPSRSFLAVFFRESDTKRLQIVVRPGKGLMIEYGDDTQRQTLGTISCDVSRPIQISIIAQGSDLTITVGGKKYHTLLKDAAMCTGSGCSIVGLGAICACEVSRLS